MNEPIAIRDELLDDASAVRSVHIAAFGRPAEGELVDSLRVNHAVAVSLVAAVEGSIVGSVVFSRVLLQAGARTIPTVALAPIAVSPRSQRQGIGSALIREGLQRCRKGGYAVCLVLGDPDYYSRFGFSHVVAQKIRSPYSGAGAAWMALELAPLSLRGVTTAVATYPEAFTLVD